MSSRALLIPVVERCAAVRLRGGGVVGGQDREVTIWVDLSPFDLEMTSRVNW